jgi:hypothetical protein
MWLYATGSLSMISSSKDYVNELSQIKIFANPSFAQIELDIPRF